MVGFVSKFGLALTTSIGAVVVNKGIASKKKAHINIQLMYSINLLLPYIPMGIYVIETSSFVH
jgi:hypothetical protein